MQIFKLIVLIGGITLAFASHRSQAESRSGAKLGEQSNVSVKSRMLANVPILSRDELGRITRVTLSRGDFVEYRYNDQSQPLLEKTLFEGKMRDREESMNYFAAQKSQHEYNLWLVGKSNPTSRNHAKSSPALNQPNLLGGDNCDLSQTACIPNMDDFWGECARNPTCFGFMDDVNSFIGNLANWLEVGAGVGGTIGGSTAILQGAEAAALLEAVGLGAFAGAALVLAFGGGYLIGTGLNALGEATYSWVVTKQGQLIPLETYLAAYSGD
jgi:YD repeat-containing protein